MSGAPAGRRRVDSQTRLPLAFAAIFWVHDQPVADCYKRIARIEESPLQRDLMLYDPDKSQFFVLNATMAYLWKHCDGSRKLDDIIADMPANFEGVDPLRASDEARAAIEELTALGLVEPS